MDRENKFWAYIWSIVIIGFVTMGAFVLHYNLERDRLPLKFTEAGISPAVVKCTNVSWSITSNYFICKKVLSNAGLTKEEAEKLVDGLQQ